MALAKGQGENPNGGDDVATKKILIPKAIEQEILEFAEKLWQQQNNC